MERQKGEDVRVVIKTVDGEDYEFKMSQDYAASKAAEIAMKHFKIDPPSGTEYRLAIKAADGSFRVLDGSKTLLDEGIKDGDTLWLGTEQVVGSRQIHRGCR